MNHIQSWVADGGTNYVSSFEAIFRKEEIHVVYFLSDGEPFESESCVIDRLQQLSKTKKIPFHTTSFGASAAGKHILKRSADVTGGTFLAIELNEPKMPQGIDPGTLLLHNIK